MSPHDYLLVDRRLLRPSYFPVVKLSYLKCNSGFGAVLEDPADLLLPTHPTSKGRYSRVEDSCHVKTLITLNSRSYVLLKQKTGVEMHTHTLSRTAY